MQNRKSVAISLSCTHSCMHTNAPPTHTHMKIERCVTLSTDLFRKRRRGARHFQQHPAARTAATRRHHPQSKWKPSWTKWMVQHWTLWHHKGSHRTRPTHFAPRPPYHRKRLSKMPVWSAACWPVSSRRPWKWTRKRRWRCRTARRGRRIPWTVTLSATAPPPWPACGSPAPTPPPSWPPPLPTRGPGWRMVRGYQMPSTLMPQVVSLFVIPLLLSYNGTVHCALTTLSDHNHVSKSWQCQTGLADFFLLFLCS